MDEKQIAFHGLIRSTYKVEKFTFWERLRILFGATVHVKVETHTEHYAGEARSSVVGVEVTL